MSNFHKTFGDFDLNLLVGTTTEATKTTNNTRWGYNFVTEGLYSFNNIIKANQYFKKSHEIDPEDVDSYLIEGRMYMEDGDRT